MVQMSFSFSFWEIDSFGRESYFLLLLFGGKVSFFLFLP